MSQDDLARSVAAAMDVDPGAFQARVAEEATALKAELEAGTFDNSQAIVGLEFEFAALSDRAAEGAGGDTARTAPAGADVGALRRVPRRLLELIGFEKELGLHNAEMSTSPQPLNEHGLAAQREELLSRLDAAQECTAREGIRLVSDAVWTIPPAGETAASYLRDHVTVDVDGQQIQLATNMSDSARYHAMGNATGTTSPGRRLRVPNAELQARTVMPESLIASIQPHYQVPTAADLPTHFRYALRVAGPLLALGANSPFVPPSLYDDGVDPETVLEQRWASSRIAIFETVMNPTTGPGKVRFPRDVETVEQAVDRVVNDALLVPMDLEVGTRFDDEFAHFRHKHGTYWRWVRPVFTGATRSGANARIEFRPIGAQPTVRDALAFQAVFAGLMESLPRREHPVADLDWAIARTNFYRAMREGIDADLRWITNDGREITDTQRLFDGLLDHAVDGLETRGLSSARATDLVAPLRDRASARNTPATWKARIVQDRLEDGVDLRGAIHGMQREYVRRQSETLFEGTFTDWV
jgi:gamma-glutamyl:cysteine ligase YbdK (ATP-grasp superfamily)